MKISSIVLMIVLVGFIFATVGLIVSDLETQYPEVTVNSSWSSKYDYSSEINQSAIRIKNLFENIGEREGGWLLLTGITAFPIAVVETVKIVILSLGKGISIVTGIGSDIGIPNTIIGFLIVIVILIIIFSLVKFWRKTEEV